jgi:hypothetical protein
MFDQVEKGGNLLASTFCHLVIHQSTKTSRTAQWLRLLKVEIANHALQPRVSLINQFLLLPLPVVLVLAKHLSPMQFGKVSGKFVGLGNCLMSKVPGGVPRIVAAVLSCVLLSWCAHFVIDPTMSMFSPPTTTPPHHHTTTPPHHHTTTAQ